MWSCRAERISELMRYLETFFEGQHVPVAIFGHIGNGNAHIVPLLNVNDRRISTGWCRHIMRSIRPCSPVSRDRFAASMAMAGCGPNTFRKMFGEELYQLFVQVKQALDPTNVMNPGIKISEASFTEHIDYQRLSKSCATCAKCNSVCPVYDVFQSEDMSSRGWFEIVTSKDYSYLNSQRVVEACLNCKSCRTVCPAGVDVSELILQRRAEHPNQGSRWIFSLQANFPYLKRFLKCWRTRSLSGTVPGPGPCLNAWPRL